jgi:hypothetical protein
MLFICSYTCFLRLTCVTGVWKTDKYSGVWPLNMSDFSIRTQQLPHALLATQCLGSSQPLPELGLQP